MLTLASVLDVAPAVIERESGDELVIVLPEKGEFFVLNGTGARIFQLVDGKSTLDEIATTIHAEHGNVNLKRIQADVLSFAGKILDKGAVRVTDEG